MAGAGSLWRVRIDASTARPEIEQLRGIGQRATGPVIARRGRRLAYVESVRDTNVWRVAATGEGLAQPLVSSTREEGSPDYSPDGARIAFASNRSGNWEVWVASSDGSNPRQVTSYGAAPAWQPQWSPNGRLLAFSHTREGNADIYTITPEGSAPRQLTSDPFSDDSPSWSRDGRSVYFSSNRSGHQIWKTALDEPARLLQVTHGGGRGPRESMDGDRLLYTKRTDSALEIWSTGVNGGAETRLLGPIHSRAGWVPITTVSTSSSRPGGSRITGLPLATSRRLPLSRRSRACSTRDWHCRPTGGGCCIRSWTVPGPTSCWLKISASRRRRCVLEGSSRG